MTHFKNLTAILLATFFLSASANQNGKSMNSKEILVIKYDYPKEEILKKSTAKLHQNNSFSFHGKGNFDVKVLGEKNDIIIPNLSESFLSFDKQFMTVNLLLEPRENWSPLDSSIIKIKTLREKLKPISDIAEKNTEFDIDKLNTDFFKQENSQVLNIYDLEHYKIVFLIRKLDTPQEIHPRDKDYYQLSIRIDNKNI